MGLDMYLDKAKRIDGATAREIRFVEKYIEYISEPKAKTYTMEEWCGINDDDVNKRLVNLYANEYVDRYSAWDTEKRFAYKCIWQNVAYWRKANQIHDWFVENVQDGNDDCDMYEVDKWQLEDLLHTCQIVKENSKLIDGKVKNGQTLVDGKWVDIIEDGRLIEDPSVARELLPTSVGCFFGSTEYDQWYMEDIDYTIDALTKLISETDFDNEVVAYQSSW